MGEIRKMSTGMVERAFITSLKTAKFVCPKCKRSKIADVAQYIQLDQIIRVKVNCPCGHSFIAILEKRKQYRKAVNLPGSFTHFNGGRVMTKGLMTVCDLSLTGIKLKVNYPYPFSVGDLLAVRFSLDDYQKTLIDKKVLIQNLNLPFIGSKFPITESEDKTLGFYLL
jgi:hypothetical protein